MTKSELIESIITGAAVELASRSVPYFKPGKELRERVNVPV